MPVVELVTPVMRHVEPVFQVAFGIPCPEADGCANSYVAPLFTVIVPVTKLIYAESLKYPLTTIAAPLIVSGFPEGTVTVCPVWMVIVPDVPSGGFAAAFHTGPSKVCHVVEAFQFPVVEDR